MSDLDDYRRAQRALRRVFDELTEALCPDCEEPCCRVPARVNVFDVMFAVAGGWNPDTVEGDPFVTAALQASYALEPGEEPVATPCPFLGPRGCVFPGDLRPAGCAAFVCKYMLIAMDARERARVRRLIAEMRRAHARVMAPIEAGFGTKPRRRPHR